MSRLVTVPISRASAEQRKGRAGRLGPGLCLRLWSAEEERGRPAHRPAEIEEADLAPLALELAAWGVADPARLRFPTPPPAGPVRAARAQLLHELGALDAERRDHRARPGHGRAAAAPAARPHGAARRRARPGCRRRSRWRPCSARATPTARRCRSRPPARACAEPGARGRAGPPAARAGAGRAVGEPPARARWARSLSLAFPDRLAQARPARAGGFRLANGRGARLDPARPAGAARPGSPWPSSTMPAPRPASAWRRRWAWPSSSDLHGDRFTTVEEVRFEPREEAVVARRVPSGWARWCCESNRSTPDPDRARRGVVRRHPRARAWTACPGPRRARQLQARVALLRRARARRLARLSDDRRCWRAWRTGSRPSWPACAGSASSLRLDLRGDPLRRLDHAQRQRSWTGGRRPRSRCRAAAGTRDRLHGRPAGARGQAAGAVRPDRDAPVDEGRMPLSCICSRRRSGRSRSPRTSPASGPRATPPCARSCAGATPSTPGPRTRSPRRRRTGRAGHCRHKPASRGGVARAEHALEDQVDMGQMVVEVEQRGEPGRVEPGGDLGVRAQQLEQRPALAPGAHRVALHQLVGPLPRQAGLGQRQQHALRAVEALASPPGCGASARDRPPARRPGRPGGAARSRRGCRRRAASPARPSCARCRARARARRSPAPGTTAARIIRASPVRFSESTGLRLCGMAELPFCPAANGSSASPTSVRCRWRTSVASRSIAAASSARAAVKAACRSRGITWVETGSGRSPNRCGDRGLDPRVDVGEGADRAGDGAGHDLVARPAPGAAGRGRTRRRSRRA